MARASLAFPAAPCRKVRYPSREAAEAHLRELGRNWREALRMLRRKPRTGFRIYRCPRCPGGVFHLTVEPDNGRPQRGGELS